MAATTTRTIFPIVFGRPYSNKLEDGTSTPLQLIRLQIEQKVNGNFPLIHQLTTTMTFKNTHNIILEGAFEFTLPEKATICGYGLDVNGFIVDGVVVEKQTARIIFEKEVRKRIDPGFVELVTGNVFRTRVYPIEPQKTRTIRVIYQDQSILNTNGYLYQIPIQFQTVLENLDIILTCFGSQTTKPTLLTNSNQLINNFPEFINKGNGEYTAEWHLTDIQPSVNSEQTLSYLLPDSSRSVLTAIETDSNIGAYFAVSCVLPKPTEQRIFDRFDLSSKIICILWDASLSRSNSKENRLLELNALKKIFDIWLTNLNEIEIIIIIFRNDMDEQILFKLQLNNWNNFLKIFEDLPYDGATNLLQLSSINLTQKINYYFLFSDCISTINTENFNSNFQAPLWIFNGNYLHEQFDFDFIRYLTQYNQYGGGYLNREKLELNSNDLITIIQTIQIKYIQIHSSSTIKQIYPSNSISIPLNSDRFLLVGQIPSPLPNSIEVELEFSMNNQTVRLPVSFNILFNQSNHFGLIRRLWAQEKLNELNAFKDKYKSDIVSIGLEYSLVSQFTSLLVLETLQQHLQYHICPAQSRTLLYEQYMQHHIQENNKKTDNLSQLVNMWDQRCQWYDRPITNIHQGGFAFGTSTFGFNSVNPNSVFGTPSGFNSVNPNYVFGTPSGFNSVDQRSGFGTPSGFNSFNPSFGFGTPSLAFNSINQNSTFGGTASTSFPVSSLVPTSYGPPSFPPTSSGPPSFPPTSSGPPSFPPTSSGPPSFPPTSFGPPSFPPTAPGPPSFPPRISGFSASPQQSNPLTNISKESSSSSTTEESSTIILKEYNPQLSYTAQISITKNLINAYSIYLNERMLHRQSPSFYFDIASYFFSSILDKKSTEYGLRILTNILELELETPQLYRTVAYKLMELKQWNLALNIFQKIYSLRSDEPQSLRDLAIVLTELVQYDQALEYFKKILTQTWDTRFSTIQPIVLFDLNQLLNLMNKIPPDIDSRLIRHLSVDIRIVVQWDTPDTVIQLSVKEPTGQTCNNSFLRETAIGGYMTSTYSQAVQPIEYLLRKAVNGKYLISLTFARNAQHTLTGATTVLVYIYKYFGSKNEEKRIQTVRLTSLNQTINVGQIEFDNSNLEKNQSSIQHINITCDGCLKNPIIGDRYKCIFCPNIDFCQNCHTLTNHQHDAKHPFICIRDSSLYTSSISLQNVTEFIHLNTHCDLCSASPIIGIRYQCMTCKINICKKCEFLCLHDISHQRVKTILPI